MVSPDDTLKPTIIDQIKASIPFILIENVAEIS